MKTRQRSFFDEEARMELLSKLGDPLEILNKVINWEMFRSVLNSACRKENTGKGGRPAFDVILMFKIIVLQRLYNLSDDQTEYQINDRRSFMRFLELELCDKVPDSKTIWKFKNDLAEMEIMEALFCLFDELEQKDTDARWTRKGNEVHFGYKNHVKCDADSKLITNYAVTDAAVHDSQRCTELLDDKEEALYADSAYSGAPIAENLPENCRNEICEKAQKGHPLTEEQKENNRRKSKIRCRIEHIFGFMTNSMHQITIRSIGITRAWFQIGLTNLVYNFCRYEFLKRPAA